MKFLGIEFGRRQPEELPRMQQDPQPKRSTPEVRSASRSGAASHSPEAIRMAKGMIDDIFKENRAERPAHLWPEINETVGRLDIAAAELETPDAGTVAEKAAATKKEVLTESEVSPEILPTATEHMLGADVVPTPDKKEPEDQFSHLTPELATKMRTYEAQRVKEPPRLEPSQFENARGEIVDFSQAQSLSELIAMLEREGTVMSEFKESTGKNQEVSAYLIINQIYKLIYQPLEKFDKSDWTGITLRHNLRTTVWNVIQKYQRSAEYQQMIGLDVSSAQTVEDVLRIVGQFGRPLIDTKGNSIGARDIQYDIQLNNLHILPGPIRYKIMQIQEREARAVLEKKNTSGIIGRTFGRLKFWGK